MRVRTLIQFYAGIQTATAIVYVTDLNEFSSLAPCAASAVSYAVQSLTNTKCPALVTALESCACSKDQIPAAVATAISSSVLYSCGTTATDDVASASKVFDRYCNQDAVVTTAAPSPTLVSQYITELAAFQSLAPCAASAVSYAVLSLTNYQCPPGASALASCACSKNQNSLAASGRINSEVRYSCGTTNTEDITSAQAVFAGYCGMAAGKTSFPVASTLAGSLTYYITDLPMYSSLAKCAASAVSYAVQSQTYDSCPKAPAILASCVCVKDQNTLAVSKSIVSDVSYYCGSTATQDISSALAVFAYYCSAGQGLITAAGVTASVTVTGGATQKTGTTSPRASGTAGTATGTSTPNSTGGASSDPNSTNTSSSGSSTGGTNTALIGGVAGGVGVIAIAGAIGIWLCLRKRKNHYQQQPQVLLSNQDGEEKPNGPGELQANQAQPTSPPPAWSQNAASVGGISPASTKLKPHDTAYEVAGGNGGPPHLQGNPISEIQGQPQGPPQGSPLHEAPGHQVWNNNTNAYEMQAYQGQAYGHPNQGNVYEMNSGYSGPQSHATVYEMNSTPYGGHNGPVHEMGDYRSRQ